MDDDTVWLTQKQMEQLFDVKQATISEHISNILDSDELDYTSIGIYDKRKGRSLKMLDIHQIVSYNCTTRWKYDKNYGNDIRRIKGICVSKNKTLPYGR